MYYGLALNTLSEASSDIRHELPSVREFRSKSMLLEIDNCPRVGSRISKRSSYTSMLPHNTARASLISNATSENLSGFALITLMDIPQLR